MIKIPYSDAKAAIMQICQDAVSGRFPTRASFLVMLKANPHIAVQGYNRFGKIFFWNDAAEGVYGYSEEEAFGQDIVELLLPTEMRKMARDMITSGAKTKRLPAAGSCDLKRNSGEYVSVYSGHLIFEWEDSSGPEFYCVDMAIEDCIEPSSESRDHIHPDRNREYA